MNILIITHFYEKDGIMGAVRWTSFAHRFAKDHNVYVVTHSNKGNKVSENGNVKIISIDNECDYIKRRRPSGKKKKEEPIQLPVIAAKKKNDLKEVLRIFLYFESMKYTAKRNSAFICSYLKNSGVEIDYIASTSRPFIDCFIALDLAKRLRVPWLMDQRDLPYSDGASDIEILFYRKAIEGMVKYISEYTLVSYGMRKSFIEFCKLGDEVSKKIYVLHNGYTSEGVKTICPAEKEKLVIAYVGDLYAGRRDAAMLFDALNILVQHGINVERNIQIEYAGDDSLSLYRNASKYGLEEVIKDNGRVPHARSIEIQQQADLLLLLTWNTEMDQGILPGKMYEYMQAEKPIICITNGNVPDGEAETMIRDMRLGVAVNSLHYENGVKELAGYLEKQLELFISTGELDYHPNRSKVKDFNYDRLYTKLLEIMGTV